MMTTKTYTQIGFIGYESMANVINISILLSVILMYIGIRHCVANKQLESSTKALWTIAIFLFPIFGAVAYLAGGRLTRKDD